MTARQAEGALSAGLRVAAAVLTAVFVPGRRARRRTRAPLGTAARHAADPAGRQAGGRDGPRPAPDDQYRTDRATYDVGGQQLIP
jgi:hypothetical protein